jgi:RNA polymerase sigma factor (sigma-70 family)
VSGSPDTADAELTRAAMAGDRGAFGKLVARHQASVRALARRLARSAPDGDDVAQAAFLAAWRYRSSWRGGSFKSWVCTIAYREFLHTWKKGGRRESTDEIDEETMSGEAGQNGEKGGEKIDLMRAMAALEENERSAIALCLGAGLSHGEAALAMEAPLGSVKSWVLRGRAKLQKALAAYGVA